MLREMDRTGRNNMGGTKFDSAHDSRRDFLRGSEGVGR